MARAKLAAKDTFRDRLNDAPSMSQEHWDDLAFLADKHECILAMFSYMLDLAQAQFNTTLNMSTATPEDRERVDLIKGQVKGYQAFVGEACNLMGDQAQRDLEAEAEIEEDYEDAAPVRVRKPRAPVRTSKRSKK